MAQGQSEDRPAQRQQIGSKRQQLHAQSHTRQCVAQVIAAARQLQVAAKVGANHLDDLGLNAKEKILDAGLVFQRVDAGKPNLVHRT